MIFVMLLYSLKVISTMYFSPLYMSDWTETDVNMILLIKTFYYLWLGKICYYTLPFISDFVIFWDGQQMSE